MNFPFYIAKRYLLSKKSHNAINVISAISVCGVALATLALICTLSVFNGFHDMVATLFTAFDPEIKITSVKGKVFYGSDQKFITISELPEVETFSRSIEENVMAQYKDRQIMVTIKGVDDNFQKLNSIDSILIGRGDFILNDSVTNYVVPGAEIVSALNSGIRFLDPIYIYAPKRGVKINVANPTSSFNSGQLFSSGLVFAVNQSKYDASYMLTSIDFVKELFGYNNEVSSIELKLKDLDDVESVKNKIQTILGPDYNVFDRYEQQADTFKIMKIEKLLSYVFLTFILLIACFNVIGSLSMLIIDKKSDVLMLRNLGADNSSIIKIFLFEGSLITLVGAISGVVLGLTLCIIQQEFGIISLGDANSLGTFVINAYPVSIHALDVILVFFTVLIIGIACVWYPVRYFGKRILLN